MLSHYALLKIDPVADQAGIEESYRNFLDEVKRYAPGVEFSESEITEHFPDIAQAYAVLRDVEKRKAYDETLFYLQPEETATGTAEDPETNQMPLMNRLSNYLLALVFLVTLLYALSHFFAL